MKIKTLVSSREGVRGCDLCSGVLVMFYFLIWAVIEQMIAFINFIICIYIFMHSSICFRAHVLQKTS